jgi:hypothetical protein
MASLSTDLHTLKDAQAAAEAFLSTQPDMEAPETQRLLARVQELFAQSEDTFN